MLCSSATARVCLSTTCTATKNLNIWQNYFMRALSQSHNTDLSKMLHCWLQHFMVWQGFFRLLLHHLDPLGRQLNYLVPSSFGRQWYTPTSWGLHKTQRQKRPVTRAGFGTTLDLKRNKKKNTVIILCFRNINRNSFSHIGTNGGNQFHHFLLTQKFHW